MNFFKRFLCLFVVAGLLVIFTGCPKTANMGNLNSEPNSGEIVTDSKGEPVKNPQGIGKQYFEFFDTVSYVYSYAGDGNEALDENAEIVAGILSEYHKLFDIYYEHSGINNLCTVNKMAGGVPLTVDRKLIDFLLYAKELYTLTNGEMNVMMGSVLKLWHDERTLAGDDPQNAKIPTEAALSEAAKYVGFDYLEIDEENNTVRITDKNARIDVGALGKGYATEKAAQALEAKGVKHYVLNIGGNIRIVGTKVNGESWKTGIKNPKNPNYEYSAYINLADTSCVTSGDYERYFTVNGQKYHHIIDGDTNMPASYFSSVTVVCKDSGLADALSTALFCMSYDEGLEIIEKIGGVGVIWIYPDGEVKYSDSIKDIVI